MNKVLVIDDQKFNRAIIKKSLEIKGIECITAENGKIGLEILQEDIHNIMLITVDRNMPIMDGMEFIKTVKNIEKYKDIPIIMITSMSEKIEICQGLEAGVYDYISKPINSDFLYLKVRNGIKFYERQKRIEELNREILKRNDELEQKVKERTQELENMTFSLLNALEKANYYNDENTGKHIQRVAAYSRIIANGAGLDEKEVHDIEMFAPIHDIGKIGIAEEILKKPGKLTKEEFEKIKEHVIIGYHMIGNTALPNIAKNIVKYHHEKWDGSGYPEGLKEENIPIEARVLAIADVFDALSTARPYKKAFSIEDSVAIIKQDSGSHFDPNLVEIFLSKLDEILNTKNKLSD